MKLQDYINTYHDGRSDWFIEEVSNAAHQLRINKVNSLKDYLNGEHAILNKQPYKYNGKEFHPRKIVLQYAKTLLNFQKSYLLQNPLTLTGNENVVGEYQKVNKQGKYDRFNLKVLDKLLKYGTVAEYIYIDNGVIKSKLIDPAECYPVYDHEGNLLSVIEAYMVNGVHYYTVFSNEIVQKYDNYGGDLRLKEQYASLSGLPIVYTTENELSITEGRSELEDWINILDNMEDMISKYTDSFYKFMTPIPVMIGQQLKGDGIPANVVGGGMNLDDGAEFKLVSNGLDYKTFDTIYKALVQSLLDISQTPAVSMNKTDISNLSEVSIKLLFQLADIKAAINEEYMREGLEQRFDKIKQLLEKYKGIVVNEDDYETLDINFQYATPSNDSEVIGNIKELRKLGGLSLESLLENSPYTTDVRMEMERLREENISSTVVSDESNSMD
ncbi:phage portal protein [Bacillus sp. JJ722]|uniref:phage portal protein n=1 Tax=Bacillus sp. JJ722 TaxID=3122973 RepID=UPI002FFEA695